MVGVFPAANAELGRTTGRVCPIDGVSEDGRRKDGKTTGMPNSHDDIPSILSKTLRALSGEYVTAIPARSNS